MVSSFEAVPYAQFHSRPLQNNILSVCLEQDCTGSGLAHVSSAESASESQLVDDNQESGKRKVLFACGLEGGEVRC